MPASDLDPDSATDAAPALLKEMFDANRFRQTARELKALYPAFDDKGFLNCALPELEPLNLMQRLRLMTECLHAALPKDYSKALGILRQWAPQIDRSFITLVLPDFVAQYGVDRFEESMEALKFFTAFGSAEFAIRVFLRKDLTRTLKVMKQWSRDENEHVRRLACEGCRPRLPWSFRLEALIADPTPVVPILENLRSDPSLYVRKSVANHLNDITKDHPEWVLERVSQWPLENKYTAWIVKRALRTLIKKGDARALALIGAGEKAQVKVRAFQTTPPKLVLGERLTLGVELDSTSKKGQRLVIDYIVHYVKKSGEASAKVFKYKELTLEAGQTVSLTRSQVVKDFSTRVHHAGWHAVELMINGEVLAKGGFDLSRSGGGKR